MHFFYFDVPNKGETVLTAVAGEYQDESRIRKVEVFNENYRLREKGAILNWFDVNAPEGYFSLNDKLSDIMAVPAGRELFMQMFKQMTENASSESMMAGVDFGPELMQMMGSFTVLRMASMMGAAGIKPTKEQLLEFNGALNQIKKPE